MREEDVEVAIKVVVVGNGAVGKSSMIQRYCKGIFTKDYKKTIGVDFLERQIRLVLGKVISQNEDDGTSSLEDHLMISMIYVVQFAIHSCIFKQCL